MHAIDKNSPSGSLLQFRERLTKKPYHTDNLSDGLRIRDVQKAIQARYIQPNGPTHRYWLVYDVDRCGAALDWNDRNAPPPTIAAQNPENGHAHLIYGLEVPIRTAPDGKPGPLRYAAAIDCALSAVLESDKGYSGLICKNPLNDFWRVSEWASQLYSLADLESWLDLTPYSDKRKRLPDYGLGRNCNLFDRLRHWAYRAIRQGWPEYERWFDAVLQRAEAYNLDFPEPLAANEIRQTAKSVAKWTYGNFSKAGFAAVQAQRGRLKGEKRRKELEVKVKDMALRGFSQRKIAEETGMSQRTIGRWLKIHKM